MQPHVRRDVNELTHLELGYGFGLVQGEKSTDKLVHQLELG